MKILVVDDSPSERMTLEVVLGRLGHQTVTADTGAGATACFASFQPDLVLLDAVLPDMDGCEVAQRMRAAGGDWVPIIFVSGRTAPSDIARGIDAGADDYLTKPFDPVVLAAKMRSMERIAEMRARLMRITRELEVANAALSKMAEQDGLTGVPNRRRLDAVLADAVGCASAARVPLSLALVDVDHFKAYNDHYGHLAGDACLQQIARALESGVNRPHDLVARYGGEEFCVLLPETHLQGALQVAERLRTAVEALALPAGEDGGYVTVSVGVATTVPQRGFSAESLIEEADRALYQAKRGGRNRSCCSLAGTTIAVEPAASLAG